GGHHVAMGEMGEAEDAEDQRHPHRAERIDRADDQARHEPLVDEEHQFVHRQRSQEADAFFHQCPPPRKLFATSGSAKSSAPVPVKRFWPPASTKPRCASASACRAFCSTIRMPTPDALISMMRSKISPI